MNQQVYNKLILETLSKLIKKHPDLRFGQLLANCGIIQYEKEVLCDGQREEILTIDPFYEESKTTWERLLLNKFAFNEQYN